MSSISQKDSSESNTTPFLETLSLNKGFPVACLHLQGEQQAKCKDSLENCMKFDAKAVFIFDLWKTVLLGWESKFLPIINHILWRGLMYI